MVLLDWNRDRAKRYSFHRSLSNRGDSIHPSRPIQSRDPAAGYGAGFPRKTRLLELPGQRDQSAIVPVPPPIEIRHSAPDYRVFRTHLSMMADLTWTSIEFHPGDILHVKAGVPLILIPKDFAAAVLNGDLCAFGGYDGSDETAGVERFRP